MPPSARAKLRIRDNNRVRNKGFLIFFDIIIDIKFYRVQRYKILKKTWDVRCEIVFFTMFLYVFFF